jgi:hypothetical protein
MVAWDGLHSKEQGMCPLVAKNPSTTHQHIPTHYRRTKKGKKNGMKTNKTYA